MRLGKYHLNGSASISSRAGGLLPLQQTIQVAGNAPHAKHAGTRFSIRIVVGVGVHVIGEGSPLPVGNHFDPGDADPVGGQEALVGRDRGVLVPFDDAKLLRRGNRGASGRSDGCGIDLAGVSRAQLEPLARVDPNGVEEPTSYELKPSDERLGRLNVALNKGDSVDRLLELRGSEMLFQSGSAEKQP